MIQGRIVDAPTIKGTINATLLKGDKGDKGDTPQLSIGEVTTLEPNESATVQISDTVISFGIPRGVQGERGEQGIQGERGEQGFSITNVTDYYALSRSASINPASLVFTTNVPTMTALDRYLWTYTKFTLGDGSTVQTNRHIISVYGDKGDQGVGVANVVAHYQVCESPINAPAKWDKDRTLTPQYKYLWSYETFTFTNGSTVNTTPRLIGVYGDRGIKGEKGDTPTITTDKSGSETTIMSDGVPIGTIKDGATPSISIGTVSTLEPDQPATATITGTAKDPVLNLGIPKGETGDDANIDVQINGTSIMENGVANIPAASPQQYGVVQTDSAYGTTIYNDKIATYAATTGNIKSGNANMRPIVPSTQHVSTFYGLATAAGDSSQSQSNNAVGTYTEDAKTAIQNMLDVPSKADVAAIQTMSIHICTAQEYDSTTRVPTIQNPDEKTFYLVPSEDGASPDLFTEWVYVNNAWEMFGSASIDLSGYLTDVQVNGTSVVSGGVANVPIAVDQSTIGVVGVNQNNGISIDSNRQLAINRPTDTQVKNGTANYRPIVPSVQHSATFYGLAKASGDTTQSQSNNSVGEYTDDAKTAIKDMLGVEDPTVTDVQINGTSILNDGVANVPLASTNEAGAVIIGSGLTLNASNKLGTNPAGTATVKQGTNVNQPIVPGRQHESTFYGLAKAAGDSTQSSSSNTVGTYTDDAKSAIQSMLGVPSEDDVVNDVQINGTSILNDGVANVPPASTDVFGVIKVGTSSSGLVLDPSGYLKTSSAYDSEVKAGTNAYKPITPSNQEKSTFYGLAKAAGDSTQSASSNAVGTYTEDAKAAIKDMIGVEVDDVQVNGTSIVNNGVANIPIATDAIPGVIKKGSGLSIYQGSLNISGATSAMAKSGTASFNPIVPIIQHESTFYGLAKAAGDTTQSQSSNAVGTYTNEAKTAIKNMLGVEQAGVSITDPNSDGNLIFGNSPYNLTTADKEEIAQQVEVPLTETVSGTTPTIVGLPNTSYICGEVTLLTITPPASGMIDVIFESGTNPAVLTLPNTVKFPEWFDVTNLESNTVYEIMITNGIYGSVMSWPI